MYSAGLLHEILQENKQTAPTELIIRAGYNLSTTNSMLLTELKGQFVCKSYVRNDLFVEMERNESNKAP